MKNIKKYTALALLILTTIITLQSQNSMTFISGINSSSVATSNSSLDFLNLQPITRMFAGIQYQRVLDNDLSLRTGFLYKQKGFEIKESVNIDILGTPIPIGVTATTEVNTLNMPLQLIYSFSKASGITPFISFGPNLSYAMNGRIKTRASAIFDFNITNTELDFTNGDYKRLGIEGQIGGGVKIPYGRGEFIAEISYSKSLNDLTTDNFIFDAGIKHQDVNFSLGYGIKF